MKESGIGIPALFRLLCGCFWPLPVMADLLNLNLGDERWH
jgi:hypothetical protein